MQKIIRDIFVGLDNVIYETIMDVYDLLLTIARTSIMSQAQITEFANRIYQLLAIFMIFKVTLSLITYVVNPDSFTEKGRGVGPLIKNIIISLSLLVLTPYIFNMAFEAQTYLLEGNTIPKLIFGKSTSSSTDDGEVTKDSTTIINTAGETMAFTAMNAFVSPNTSVIVECAELYDVDGNPNEKCTGINIDGDYKLSTKSDINIATVATTEMAQNYTAGLVNENYYLTFREDLLTTKAKDSKEFVMTYHYFISTAVGIVMLLLLINFCMDIAVRSIKLSFYQLIAPIPIISYIDPKNGKDGMFKKWYKAAASTYLSLFIRLFVIYFAIYLINMVAEMNIYDVVTGQIISGGFLLKVFMLIGVLMFAKQMPKILEGLGLKIDGGGFTLNPLKKVENEALGGKRLMGAAGAMVAAGADRGARMAFAPNNKERLKALMGTPMGIAGAAARGFGSNAGYSGGKKAQANVNRRLRESRIKGLSQREAYLDYLGSKYGLDNATLEPEAYYQAQNDEMHKQAGKEIEAVTRGEKLKMDNEKNRQKTMNNTKAARTNVKSQSNRMMDIAKDVANKKGDLGSKNANEISELLQKAKGRVYDDNMRAIFRSRGISDEEVAQAMGLKSVTNLDKTTIDDYKVQNAQTYAKTENAKNYTSNRKANAANVEKLETLNNTDGVLNEDIYIGGTLIAKQGTKVDGDVVAAAKKAEGYYIKQSDEAIFNEMLSGSDAIMNVAGSETQSFSNIMREFDDAVISAKTTSEAYNTEYNKSINTDITGGKKASDMTAGDFKDIINNMDNDADASDINMSISESNNIIEECERNIQKVQTEKTHKYYDESGTLIDMKYNEYDTYSKPREQQLNELKEKHKNLQDIGNANSVFGSSK